MPNQNDFRRLVSLRWSVSIAFSILMFSAYFGFILTVAFRKEWLATPVAGNIPLGLPLGLGMIALAWILTAAYVRWANQVYDKKVQTLKNQK